MQPRRGVKAHVTLRLFCLAQLSQQTYVHEDDLALPPPLLPCVMPSMCGCRPQMRSRPVQDGVYAIGIATVYGNTSGTSTGLQLQRALQSNCYMSAFSRCLQVPTSSQVHLLQQAAVLRYCYPSNSRLMCWWSHVPAPSASQHRQQYLSVPALVPPGGF